MLLADIRHPNVVQLIKVGIKPVLCMVTELLVCSLHAMIHNDSGGALREKLLQREAVPQVRSTALVRLHLPNRFPAPTIQVRMFALLLFFIERANASDLHAHRPRHELLTLTGQNCAPSQSQLEKSIT